MYKEQWFHLNWNRFMCNHTYHSLDLFWCLPLLSPAEVFSSHHQKQDTFELEPVNDWRCVLIPLKG